MELKEINSTSILNKNAFAHDGNYCGRNIAIAQFSWALSEYQTKQCNWNMALHI